MRYPALVFITKLVWPVDAGHTQDDTRQTVNAVIIKYVLIRCALRTPVRRVEVERASLRHTFGKILELVSGRTLHNTQMFEGAVYFIR